MKTEQLIPRLPRRMKQPRKDTLRQIIRNRDAEIFRLKDEIQRLRRPWHARLAGFLRGLRSIKQPQQEPTP